MLLLNPSLSFLHDTYCCFSSQKYSYCISYILHVVWLSVITISLSIHRWGKQRIFSLSAYESPSNGQDQVLSIPRLPDNPGLPGGCYLDCFRRSCGDIAGSGKRDNFLFLVIIIMVIFQGLGVYLIHSCFSYLYQEPITRSEQLFLIQRRFTDQVNKSVIKNRRPEKCICDVLIAFSSSFCNYLTMDVNA